MIAMKKIKIKKINNKSLKFGSYALTVTTVIIAIIVVFNALLGLDFVRDRLRFDITKDKKFSLSETSINLIKDLDKDVEVIILTEEKNFKGNYVVDSIADILKQYNIRSNGRIKTRFVDIIKDPTFIERELDPEQVMGLKDDSIVVKCGKKIKVISQNDLVEYDYSSYTSNPSALKIKRAFSSAIKSVTADVTPVVYFVTGHGERSVDSNFSDLKSTMVANNYDVQELALTGAIPDDAAAVIFLAPKTDLLANEMENLLAYMEKGGDAIFLMDVQETATPTPNFDAIFERYSLALNNDYVLEGDQRWYLNDFNIIIPQPNNNDVTTNLDPNSRFIYMPNCRSVSILQAEQQWIKTQPLFMTSSKSQSTNLLTNELALGPFLLGALSEFQSSKTSKIALIGNSVFVSDTWMDTTNSNGIRYILSILNWMQEKADSIIVPSKSLATEPINMSESTRFIAFIVLSFVLPLMIIGLGLFVWIRRKHL